MVRLIEKGLLSFFGKLAYKAATCEAPPPVVVKLPEKNSALAAIAWESMQEEAMFRAMAENAWEVVACLAPDCTLRYTTRSVVRVLEYTPEEIVGKIGFEFVYPEDRPRIMDLFEQVVMNIRPRTVAQFRLVTKTGKIRWVQCTGTNLLANPAVNSVVIYYHDITESKITEDEARKSRESLALALKAAKMGTFDWDLITGKSIWSEQTESVYGFAHGEFQGTLEEIRARIVPEDFEKLTLLKEAIQAGNEYYVEYRINLLDGSERWVMNRGRPLLDSRGTAVRVVGIASDITDQKQHEHFLSENERRLRAASQAKSQFLANMSHEIRTPLGAILGFTELIRDPKISQMDRMKYAEIVHQNGHQLATVINDILDLSKVEAGKMDVQACVFSLASLVAETISFLRPLADQRQVELKVARVPSDLPEKVISDPARVKQVLNNIIGNAIKFTRSGGEIVVSLGILETNSHRCAIVEVRDTGIGMDEEQQKHIFDAFFQADSSMTRKHGGTGLGLSLSKHLAKLLGGDLTLVKSVPHKGSTFRFAFDLNKDMLAAVERETSSSKRPIKSISGTRVLLAEDSPDNQLLIGRFLSTAGAYVETVDNGQAAVERALAENFDIVLMDIQMPILDGYKATEILRSKGYPGKIVALTAHALVEERAHSFEVGCDEHLTKPVDRAKLIETVARWSEL